jgi:endonuclease/exonuclease/phosphatase family metal-dependent hydrolase
MRVMTFNIWNYNPSWKERRALIAGLIKHHQPDVVALQETRHDFRFERGKGQGEQIAELTGYYPTFALGQVYIPLLRVAEGLTILARDAPVRTTVEQLTRHWGERADQNQRVCLCVTVSSGGSLFHVFDTHFSLSAAARRTNALEVTRFVAEQAQGEPAVLMGDLNAEPDAPEIRFLTGQEPLEGQTASFTDCWTSAHPDAPGFTYASFNPVRRIDYVLGLNLPAGVKGAEIIGGEASNGVYPSDHMGLVVDL